MGWQTRRRCNSSGMGPMREIHSSWSSDPPVRQKAAAGGTLTALGRDLLSSGRVDAILQVRADDRRPWLTTATLSRTRGDVLGAASWTLGVANNQNAQSLKNPIM
ncbi:hypothetical protein I6F31_05500 [Bradyrhizobium sp. NBAIM01]|nr:hypothetical protein [Bradyrhizobium sp. NBAIM01]